MSNKIIITGAPGTGKTTLISMLGESSCLIRPEVARRVIFENINNNNTVLPWGDRKAFDSMVLLYMLFDYFDSSNNDYVYFDGGIPDILAYERFLGLPKNEFDLIANEYKYNSVVVVVEPWREIYVQDEFRPWNFQQVQDIHQSILSTYQQLGYNILLIPKETDPTERLQILQDKWNVKKHNKDHDANPG